MTIIFYDEKKLKVDGPDGILCYWYDLRKEKQVFPKRPFGGGSVMFWRAFSANGNAELVVMEGRQNTQKYLEVLEANLLPFAEVHHGQDLIFLQDNVTIHTAKATKGWFKDKNVTVLD